MLSHVSTGKPLIKLLRFRFLLPQVIALGLVGCTTYPMGLNKAQWEGLSPAQQAEFRAQQYVIDEERARRHAEAEARRIQFQREAEEREQLRIAEAYRHARYGDVVTVTVRDGLLPFYGKCYSFEPIVFDLVRGETKSIVFRRRGQPHITTEIVMHLDGDGNTFYFDYPSRNRFVAVNDGWLRGREYRCVTSGNQRLNTSEEALRIAVRYRSLPTGTPAP